MKNKVKDARGAKPSGLSLAAPYLTVFISSFCIMVLELVATRLIARYLGSSLYTWTGVIGVVLAGITIGNYIGGRIADRCAARRTLAIIFVSCSVACVLTVVANNLVGKWTMLYQLPLAARVFAHVSLVFLPSATLLGMISPVVAKMALDEGLPPGRTVGSIYAWGAAGSIAGTFAAGYYLIAVLGSVAIIWVVAAVLLLLGLLYFVKLWFSHVWLLLLVVAMMLGLGPWDWTQQAGAALALRNKLDENTLYEDETQYCYVAVNKVPGPGNIRDFVQDKLLHSRVDMDDITNLCYFYEDVFATVTEKLYPDKKPLSVLVIGGGGYSFPRYIQKVWPQSAIDVVEIDPGVTEAAMTAFGLPRDTTIKTINMDGRNYVDELLNQRAQIGRIQRYDIIYEDAINDYSVPFQLTTREFNEKILQLLDDDGFYLVNLIDVYDDGLFLGAIANTLQQTFPYVTVITETAVPRSHRNTFILVAARHQLELEDLAEQCRRKGILIWHLTEADIETVKAKVNYLVLTDDYAPIENLLASVVRRKTAYDLAAHYFTQATKQFNEGQFDQSVDYYKKIIARAPSMAIKAYNDMAVVMLKQGNMTQAAQALRQALTLIEEEKMYIYTGNIHYNLAVVLSRMNQPQEAADHFDKAITDFKKQLIYTPKNAELYLKIGKSLASTAKIKEAEEYFLKALNLNPNERMSHLELARNLELQERFDDAINLLQESIRYMTYRQNKDAVFEFTNYMEKIKNRKQNTQ